MQEDFPTVGDIVHYVAYGTPGGEFKPEHRAAIITEVVNQDEDCGLCVLNPTGMFFNSPIPHDENCEPGTWHWHEGV
jgi:hypothetical protein